MARRQRHLREQRAAVNSTLLRLDSPRIELGYPKARIGLHVSGRYPPDEWPVQVREWPIRSGQPVVRWERFETHVALTVGGDDEAMPLGEDFGERDGSTEYRRLAASEWGSRGREMVLTGSAMDETIGVSAGTTTMHALDSGAISQSVRKWYSLHVVVVESSCDGSLHHVPEGGRRAWRRRSQ